MENQTQRLEFPHSYKVARKSDGIQRAEQAARR